MFNFGLFSEPPPSITVPQNVSVLPGDSAILTCNVFSTVAHNVTWHAAGYDGHLKNSQKFFQFKNDSLLVRNVQMEDEGKYVCRASNEGGMSQQSIFIRVQGACFVNQRLFFFSVTQLFFNLWPLFFTFLV